MHQHKRTISSVKALMIGLFKQTYENWRDDRTMRLGAGLAYYGLFAIVPILTLAIGVAAYFFSTPEIESFVDDRLVSFFGSDAIGLYDKVADSTGDLLTGHSLTSLGVFGIASLIVSASFIFLALQDALDTIWRNPVRRGWRKSIKRYIWSYVIVLISSSLLFVALVINSSAALAKHLIPGELPFLESLADLLVSVGSSIFGIVVLAVIFRLLIYKKVSWKIIIIGSVVTSILIVIGTWLLGLYMSNFAGRSIGGALGAVLLVLVWIYYEAQILLIGSQLTKTIAFNMDEIIATADEVNKSVKKLAPKL